MVLLNRGLSLAQSMTDYPALWTFTFTSEYTGSGERRILVI